MEANAFHASIQDHHRSISMTPNSGPAGYATPPAGNGPAQYPPTTPTGNGPSYPGSGAPPQQPPQQQQQQISVPPTSTTSPPNSGAVSLTNNNANNNGSPVDGQLKRDKDAIYKLVL